MPHLLLLICLLQRLLPSNTQRCWGLQITKFRHRYSRGYFLWEYAPPAAILSSGGRVTGASVSGGLLAAVSREQKESSLSSPCPGPGTACYICMRTQRFRWLSNHNGISSAAARRPVLCQHRQHGACCDADARRRDRGIRDLSCAGFQAPAPFPRLPALAAQSMGHSIVLMVLCWVVQ